MISLFKSAQKVSYSVFLAELAALQPGIHELNGEPWPEDAREIRDRHRKILEIVAALFVREVKDLKQFSGADVAPEALASVIEDTWQDLLRPEYNAIEDFIRETGEFDAPAKRRDPNDEHRLTAAQLGVGGR